jgi:phage tail sheath protein FI
VVIVRVEDGIDTDATLANIVGDGVSTGLQAFIAAGPELGIIPRLICAPGFTSQRSVGEANPVCAALPAICEKLLAHAVVDGPATTEQDAIDWRETIASQRLIPVDPAVKVFEDGVSVVQPLSPAVIGIGVRRDHEMQGRPFHSWANQPVQGIVGPSRPINFSLTDGATEGQRLLSANIGVLLRGEMGVESAIGPGGFIFVGTDNAGEDDLWRFYNVTRGRDFIHLMLLRTLRFYLGRFNVTGQTVQAILNTMETGLRNLKADGDILGFEIKFTRDQNTPEELRQGRFTVTFAAEEAPVLRYLGVQSARYRPALDALLDDLLAQVGTITG